MDRVLLLDGNSAIFNFFVRLFSRMFVGCGILWDENFGKLVVLSTPIIYLSRIKRCPKDQQKIATLFLIDSASKEK